MKIIFLGTPDFAQVVFHTLEKNHQVLKLNGLDTQKIKDFQPELLVVAAFGKIIPQEILDIPKYGALNVHPSLLPKYRGPTPGQAAILAGDEISGVTIIKLDEKMDHGPILAQKEIPILETDTAESFYNKAFQEGTVLLARVIPDFIEGKLKPREQDHSSATFCKILKKEDGYFDANNPPSPETFNKMVRSYYPWPAVWTLWSKKIVKFQPGDLIQIEGKKAVSVRDFLNGHPDFPIKQLLQQLEAYSLPH